MPRMEVISSAGTALETGNSARITQPGSIIKVTLPKYEISGVQKFGNDLVLVQGDNEQIIIEGFFVEKGQEKNKLVIEDERALFDGEGQLYLAEYDAENFAGLEFVPIASMDEVMGEHAAEEGDTNHAVWLIPLIGAAVVGAAIAISNSNDDDDNSSNNNNNNNNNSNDAKDALESAKNTYKAKLDDLTAAKQALVDAVAAMQANPTAETIQAVNDAKTALENATSSLSDAKTQLDSAVATAKKEGLDTTEAESVMSNAAEDIASAEAAVEQAAAMVESAQAMLDHVLNVNSTHANTLAVKDTATNAKQNPSQENIDDAINQLNSLVAGGDVSLAKASLMRLQNALEMLKQAVETAEGHGINVDEAKALLEALDGKYEQLLAEIQAEIDAAHVNKAAVDAAHEAAAKAVAALEAAEAAELLAKEKLEEALALKESVIASNDQTRIDEVNQLIISANAALDAAKEAVANANDAVNAANDAIGNISDEVSKEFIPELIDLKNELDELEAIDKGVMLQEEKSFWEALQTLADTVINSFREIFQQILDSKPVQIIKDIIEGISNAISTVWNVFVEAVKGGFNIIKLAIKGIADLIGEGVEFVVDIIKLGVETVKDAIAGGIEVIIKGAGGIVSGIVDAVKDGIAGMGILDLLDLTKVVNLVIEVISNSVKNIVDNIWNLIKEIPGKIVDYIYDKITAGVGEITEGLSDAFNIIKTALTDIVTEFYNAFIKNPFDSIIKPIVDKIWDIITHPFEYIGDVITAIIDTIKDGIAIIKSIIELPGKLIDAFVEFIKEVITSEGDLVVEGDGSEIGSILDAVQDMANAFEDSGSLTESENAALQELSDALSASAKSANINLDEVAPQAAENDDVIAIMDSASTQVEVFHNAVVNQENDEVSAVIALVA